jgi:hypothetical protein
VTTSPDLTITKTHAGNFTQGQTGATYTITVTVPSGLTATAISGTGWTCTQPSGPCTRNDILAGTGWSCTQPSGPCTRSDVLAGGASYPAITLTVNVASNAPASVANSATVSGGGESNTANNTANDPTTIVAPGAVVPIPVMSSFGWAMMVALLLDVGIAAMRRPHA